jgi:hypothetical protein
VSGGPHRYLSTACHHEAADGDPALHAACRATCKFCDARCSCPAHRLGEAGAVAAASGVGQAREIARELLYHALSAAPAPPRLLRRIAADPGLFWLRGEEQPPGRWSPPDSG